jgi:hypothetical protein
MVTKLAAALRAPQMSTPHGPRALAGLGGIFGGPQQSVVRVIRKAD